MLDLALSHASGVLSRLSRAGWTSNLPDGSIKGSTIKGIWNARLAGDSAVVLMMWLYRQLPLSLWLFLPKLGDEQPCMCPLDRSASAKVCPQSSYGHISDIYIRRSFAWLLDESKAHVLNPIRWAIGSMVDYSAESRCFLHAEGFWTPNMRILDVIWADLEPLRIGKRGRSPSTVLWG